MLTLLFLQLFLLSANADLRGFTVVMASDPQYGYGECAPFSQSYTTANYVNVPSDWCENRRSSSQIFWRRNNFMNGISDVMLTDFPLTHQPIGANIIGDLTNGAHQDQRRLFTDKVNEIEQTWGQGNVRIWQALGNHDLNKDFAFINTDCIGACRYTSIREHSVKPMKQLAKDNYNHNAPDGSHKWFDSYCGDPDSAAYAYKKSGVVFVQLQLGGAAKFVRAKPSETWGLPGASGWFLDLLADKNCGDFSVVSDDVVGIILMYHYPDSCQDGLKPPVDCPRWHQVVEAMKNHNQNYPSKRIMAVFNGHYHAKSGYEAYDPLLKDLNIPQFFAGGPDYNMFLSVDVYYEAKYFVVNSYAVKGNEPADGYPSSGRVASGFERRCVSKHGHSDLYPNRCTKWSFSGMDDAYTYDFPESDCETASNKKTCKPNNKPTMYQKIPDGHLVPGLFGSSNPGFNATETAVEQNSGSVSTWTPQLYGIVIGGAFVLSSIMFYGICWLSNKHSNVVGESKNNENLDSVV